jgi:hypothetical protein
MESDCDIIATIKYLEKEWCRYIDVQYPWVKGHVDRLDFPMTQGERLNVEVDTLTDHIRYET